MAYLSKEKTAEIRNNLKAAFPSKDGWKFSVRNEHYTSLRVVILKAPVYFDTEKSEYVNINHYWYKTHEGYESRGVIEKIVNICMDGNHDNSDAMTDYFDVGWYFTLTAGDYDRPFEFTGDEDNPFGPGLDNDEGEGWIDERNATEEYEACQKEYEEYRERSATARQKIEEIRSSRPICKNSNTDVFHYYRFDGCQHQSLEAARNYKTDLVRREKVKVLGLWPLLNDEYNFIADNLQEISGEWVRQYGGAESSDPRLEKYGEDWLYNTEAIDIFRESCHTLALMILNLDTGESFVLNSEGREWFEYVGLPELTAVV